MQSLIKDRNMNTILKLTVKITHINNMHVEKSLKAAEIPNKLTER